MSEIEVLSDKLAKALGDNKQIKRLRWASEFFLDIKMGKYTNEQILEVIAKGAQKALDAKKKVGFNIEFEQVYHTDPETLRDLDYWSSGQWQRCNSGGTST